MARVRGSTILGTVDYVARAFGPDAPSRLFAALPEPLRQALGDAGARHVITTGWYECGLLSELSRVVDATFGSGDLAVARAAGKHIAFHDVNRFFRWMLRLGGPQLLFQRAGSVWNNYHDEGRYVAEEVGAGRAALRLEDWSGADPVMCKRVEGWMEKALEITLGNSRKPVIREVAHLHPDPSGRCRSFCRYLAEWES
jgi:hypothetical protein